MWKKILDRLRQPSTVAGLSAIGVLVGVPPGTIDLVGQAVIGVAGIVGVLTDEHAGKADAAK